ncbi:ATPase family associated with various cellular activities (AAA) [Devosia equisanguinis]|uniref:ATPase family associated with various cellular activities (AAA) n=2 Tax=Devosia equisanguinis TaxID=2490941 RepID=A0A3S4D729_9HYPH|nr:ATPase family associated with various cellular activities (AAA) [Devosia equisanguinis]
MPSSGNSTMSANAATAEQMADAEMNRLLTALRAAQAEIGRTVLGQERIVEDLLIGLIAGGHVLLEGPPGVGKTLLVRTLATATGLSFARVQFTPDLMPADITGSMVLVPDTNGRNTLEFQRGAIFTQLLLADEINRATPRTQSALLEAMQERTVSAAGQTMPLPEPFFVLATQNPLEMDGTYILPEAQIDRFLLQLDVPLPTAETLAAILDSTTGSVSTTVQQFLTPADILAIQALVRSVPMADHVRRAIANFAISTHPVGANASADVKRYLRFGLSPRGAQALVLAAKGHALLNGRFNVSFDDIRAMLLATTRHRVHLNFEGRADGVSLETLLGRLLDASIKGVL